MQFSEVVGATPLDPDEAAGLIPKHLVTQNDLNLWEEANILEGERWALRQKRRDVLDESFLRDLHRKMFDSTWRWAGTFRSSNKNIGVDWAQISTRLRNLLDNTRYQIEHQVFVVDELAIRFHHQLVWIHPFPNGNGRHARLVTDVLALKLKQARFSWGGKTAALTTPSEARQLYLQALRRADAGDFDLLIKFARA